MAESVRNDPRTLFGWAMYDWANSAYVTTTAAALFPAYFTTAVVPVGGWEILGRSVSGEALWGYLVGGATFLVFLLTPVLGAIADYSAAKKRFLRVFAYGGATFATSLVVVGTGDVWLGMTLFFLSQAGFVGANVFYDGFLPDITTPETIDRVSARGFAFGYVGGGLQFALALGLVTLHGPLGLSEGLAVRLAIGMAGLWWMGFSVLSFRRLRETGRARRLPSGVRGAARPVAY